MLDKAGSRHQVGLGALRRSLVIANIANLLLELQAKEAAKLAQEKITHAPTIGAMFSMHGTHYVMHAGQWAVVRRQLGRKPLF